MYYKSSKKISLEILETFTTKELSKYSYLRNFDFGFKKRSNTSCLSPYINHGILSEEEIIQKSIKENSIEKAEKFIQEVLWRIYWKGWLELRPNVWFDFIRYLEDKKINFLNNENYLKAIAGETKIECFNDWINELKKK